MSASTAEDRGRVAVIGGTGWVGRHVDAALRRRGHDVLVLARHPAAHVPARRFRRMDLTRTVSGDLAELLRAERVGTVVHATDGANATDGWHRSNDELTAANVHAVDTLLAALARGVPRGCPARLVHLGTVLEYGPVPDGTLLDGTIRADPTTAYARSKLAGSEAVLAASRRGDVDAVVLRLASVCGPHPSPASFVGTLLGILRQVTPGRGRPEVTVTDDRRDFVDVRDVADAVVCAVVRTGGSAVGIGTGVATPVRQLVSGLVAAAGLPADALAVRRRARAGFGGRWMQVDPEPARRVLGWRSRVGLSRSLRDTWLAASPGADA